jgi:hypothetical protein
MQPRSEKSGVVEQGHATQFKGMSRSHHVEVVLEHILAKRRQHLEQKPSVDLDWEAKQEAEGELPVKEGG